MTTSVKAKTEMFEIGFTAHYHELSEWSCDYIKADDQHDALRKFAIRHKLKQIDLNDPESWRWWEDDWYMAFKYIKPVNVKSCPHCGGLGVIFIDSGEGIVDGSEE